MPLNRWIDSERSDDGVHAGSGSIDLCAVNEPRATNGSPAFAGSLACSEGLIGRGNMNSYFDGNATEKGLLLYPAFEMSGVIETLVNHRPSVLVHWPTA